MLLIERLQGYYTDINKGSLQCAVSLLRLDYESYRYVPALDVLRVPECKDEAKHPKAGLVDDLARFVYKNGDNRSVLCRIEYITSHQSFRT